MPSPYPKDPKLRQRTNRHSTAAKLIDSSPLLDGELPKLPPKRGPRGGKAQWRQETLDWWSDVWESPMASEYTQSDLHGLYILADLIDRYWKGPTINLATEIRLQRQNFGLTPLDRRRLQWEIQRGEEAEGKRRNPRSRNESAADDPRAGLRAVK